MTSTAEDSNMEFVKLSRKVNIYFKVIIGSHNFIC